MPARVVRVFFVADETAMQGVPVLFYGKLEGNGINSPRGRR